MRCLRYMNTSQANMSDEQWRKQLDEQQYRILREHGTEPAFTGVLLDEHRPGEFHCAACDQLLFRSDAKFDSGSGWPSFASAADSGTATLHEDNAFGMRRTEVRCSQCGGHLGHLFDDGPRDQGGMRYCINSAAMKFEQTSSDNAAPAE